MKYLISLFLLLIATGSQADELIIEPDAGRAPILAAIKHSQSSVYLVMYGLNDTPFIQALIYAKNAHKHVQVLLEPQPYKNPQENNTAYMQLSAAPIAVGRPNPKFLFTHQKTFIFDQQRALIQTFNLTPNSFSKERNFGLVITDRAMLAEIMRVFNADWQHQPVTVTQPNLIWSPDNSRKKIMNFIQSAKSELDLYEQDISDYKIIGALAKAARAGVHVNLLLSQPPEPNPHHRKLAYLRKAGVHICFSKRYIIHAKVIMADQQQAIIGSINLTRNSLENNRELAVITRDPKVIQKLITVFEQDWEQANRKEM